MLYTLGEGGMGVVYAARDNKLGRKVAIKVVHKAPGDESRGRARMLREAQAMARLSHPNVVQVYEVGEHDGQVYVAMEFVKGRTLRDWQNESTRSWKEILERYLEAGRGLAAAHKKGLVHCDFKPHNVLVDDEEGRVRVLDFGLARTYHQQSVNVKARKAAALGAQRAGLETLETSMTVSDTVTGTPAYMSPEQYQGRRATAYSDQFSFCVAIYEGLYGARPFSGQNPAALAFQVSAGEIEDPPRDAKVPSWLRRVIVRGLSPDPEERWPSMEALMSALQRDAGAARRFRVRIEGINIERFKLLSSAGYEQLKPFRDGQATVVYAGLRAEDHKPVLVKLLRNEAPTPSELARMRRERSLLERFDDPGVVRALRLEHHGRGLALALENFGGTSLRQRIVETGGLTVDEFLRFSTKLVDALAVVHAEGLVHKDISPEHILFHRASGRVALMDFDVASEISEEAPSVVDPDQLEGTLAYMAPEQTGRMNRKVDYRSDYYALGVTFYEALTGQLPFETSHPMELVHAHIALAPTPPSEVSANVPEALSRIVLRLMSKTAEDRYQSADGLRLDLERCAREWDRHGWIEDFEPGEHDTTDTFQIPQKLYGREHSVNLLMAAFERAASGSTEVMLIAGPSGIGKSAVIREVHKPIVARRGYFISGKSDPLSRDVPYTAIIQAFQDLFKQLLRESDESLQRWRDRLLKALSGQGQVLVDVVPELELIIGAQAPVPGLPPTESANRFRSLFSKLVQVFAREEHPLVLFLDDLQWSDLAALKLIEQLAIDNELANLLILGAYRDHEVPPDHLLNQIVRAIEEAGREIARHTLQPLDLEHTAALVRDTLTPTKRDAGELVRVIQTKTEGNPFFVRVLLSSLYEQGALRFDRSQGGWLWDDAELASVRLSDDIVALMSSRIGELSRPARDAIEHAACLGNRFTLELLSIITEQQPRIVVRDLWEALERGLIQALGDSYKYVGASSEGSSTTLSLPHDIEYRFVHDKVQHAAYSRLDPRRRQEIHLRVGRLLLARAEADGEELGDKLFTVTAHLAAAAPLINAPDERLNLARLNLAAGRRAKLAIAYRSAVNHLRSGVDLLPDDAWRSQYELTFALHRELMESEYLGGNVEAALVLFQPLVDRARTDLERAEVYELKVSLETYRKQNALALATAFEGLAQLGVHLPQSATVPIVLLEFLRVQLARRWRGAEELTGLPDLDEPRKRLLQRLLTTAAPAAYFVDTKLAALILLKSARISLRDGYTDMSAFGIAGYGFVLSGVFGRHKEAYEFGKLALRLNERFKNSWLDVKLDFLVGLFIANWVEPFAAARRRLHRSYQQGIGQGDLAFALYSGVMYTNVALVQGQTVDRIYGLAESMEPTAQRAGEIDGIAMLTSIKRMCMALRGQTLQPTRFDTVDWSEQDFERGLDDKTTPQAMFYYNLHKLIALYLFGEYEAARAVSTRLEQRLETVLAQPASADFVFYDALTAAARYGAATRRDRGRIRGALARATKKLQRWSGFCPNNFAARLLIVRAEQARVLGRRDTFILYNQAIQTARTHESIICEALALELTARYALGAGYDVAVESYATAACDAYRRWGARAKVEQLSHEFGDHFPMYALPPALEEPEPAASASATMTSTAQDLDRVSRTFQSIVHDLNLDGLLTNMTQTLTEFTGARHCVVLLERDGALTVEAEGGLPPMSVQLGRGRAPVESGMLCETIVNYVARTHQPVLLTNAAELGDFTDDPYIKRGSVRSVLCAPMMLRRDDLVGVVYLENGLTPDVFRHEHVASLAQLLPPVAVAIRTAMRANSYRRFVPHAALERLATRMRRELRPGDHINLEGTVQALALRGTAALVGDGRGMRSALTVLNRFFDAAASIAERNGGFIGERASDSMIICYPGGSGPALTAATELLEVGHELFIRSEHASNYAGVDVGVALHAGSVTIGAVGSDHELSLVTLSRTVTIAKTLARRCDSYGAPLLISETVRAQLPETGNLEIRALNRLDPEDGMGSLGIFEVFSELPSDARGASADDQAGERYAERLAGELRETLTDSRADLPVERS